MSEIKNGRLGLYGKVQQLEELGFKGLKTLLFAVFHSHLSLGQADFEFDHSVTVFRSHCSRLSQPT